MDDLIKEFYTARETTQIIEQTKVETRFILDKYFMNSKEKMYSISIQIPIEKGNSIILSSVSENGDHIVVDNNESILATLTIPRFPQESIITATDINTISHFRDVRDKQKGFSQRIKQATEKHKRYFHTTLEFMATGALFGRVLDGKGKELFKMENKADPITFTQDKALINSTNEIEDKLVEELGYVPPYSILASRTFINTIVANANKEELFKNGEAKWNEKGRIRTLVVHGIEYIPYTAKYKNEKGESIDYIKDKEAIAIPQSEEVYKLFYSYPNHTDALNKEPTLYFTGAPEKLKSGKGYSIVSEMRAIPICVRPNALIKLKAE